MDLHLRNLLFPDTPYEYECGGRTEDIAHLDIGQVIRSIFNLF